MEKKSDTKKDKEKDQNLYRTGRNGWEIQQCPGIQVGTGRSFKVKLCVCVCVCVSIYDSYIYTHIYIYTHTYIYAYICIYIYVYILSMSVRNSYPNKCDNNSKSKLRSLRDVYLLC